MADGVRQMRPGFWLARVALASLMVLASVNIWTGAPLFALWVGSRVQGDSALTMSAVFSVIGTLAVLVLALAVAVTRLGQAYDTLTGRPVRRQRASWLRSLRDEPSNIDAHASQLSLLEKLMIASAVTAGLAFEVWFFFFAGSPLPA